jgi:hypothetical protein
MRSGVLTNLVVVALCACITAAEQPVQSFPGDIIMMAVEEPNAPDRPIPPPRQNAVEPWNPGKHLLATWESLSTVRTHRIYNPALQPPREPEGPGWSLSLAGQTWIELVPGLEILVEQAVAENAPSPSRVRTANGQYQFRLRARYDSREVFCLLAATLHLPASQTPPRVIVVDLDVLDAKGRSIRSLGSVSGGIMVGTGGTGSQAATIIHGTGNGPACATAATFRFKLALNAYARHIRFILENVPVPSFRD